MVERESFGNRIELCRSAVRLPVYLHPCVHMSVNSICMIEVHTHNLLRLVYVREDRLVVSTNGQVCTALCHISVTEVLMVLIN